MLNSSISPLDPTEIFLRFGNFLLACAIYLAHLCRSFSQEMSTFCQMIGLCGFAFYFALEFVANQRAREEINSILDVSVRADFADQQLSKRLCAEQRMAKLREKERRTKRRASNLEELLLSASVTNLTQSKN